MNKYIKTDIEQGTAYQKIGIMNALHDIDSGSEKEIDLGENISWNLLYHCLQEAKWEVLKDFDYNGWEIDFWIHCYSPSKKYCLIQGSLWGGLSYKIEVCDNGKD